MISNCEKDPILATIDQVDELICDEAHWGQGEWSGGNKGRPLSETRLCPMTALNSVRGQPWTMFSKVNEYFERAVPPMAPAAGIDYGGRVAFYNNRPERKFADIKALIAKARALRVVDLMKDKVLVVIGPGRQAHN